MGIYNVRPLDVEFISQTDHALCHGSFSSQSVHTEATMYYRVQFVTGRPPRLRGPTQICCDCGHPGYFIDQKLLQEHVHNKWAKQPPTTIICNRSMFTLLPVSGKSLVGL